MTTHFEPISTEADALTERPGLVAPMFDPPEGAASMPARPEPRPAADLVALTKPRITLMVVITMLGGIWLALHRVGRGAAPSMVTLAIAVAGTALVVGSANALNMYLERDSDRFMARTKNRPLPAGRLAPNAALAFGLVLGLISVPALTFAVNAVTGLLAAVALVSYVCVYTPLKRRTTVSLLIGAIPGAIPPLLGWTAVTGRIEWPGVILFGIMFLWQVPHFLAIAIFRREDYVRAGLKVLPAERGERVTRLHIVAYTVALVAVTLALVATGVGGRFYLGVAMILGGAFLAHSARGLLPGSGVRWARGLFGASILYLVLLFAALMVSPTHDGGASVPSPLPFEASL
ncbi:Heme O synthase, protoheme IX farnesyltransferase [Minicystis rosea]|nr:Heme O synthase, protoheme IX farnesyltransferase [Minicystis rosea]